MIIQTTKAVQQDLAKDTSQYLTINTVQVLTVSGTSAVSAAVNLATNKIVISTTTDCWVAIGSNPTAVSRTANNFFMAAGSQSFPIAIVPGISKIAVIQDTAGGYTSILESM